jgi:multidrug efflux pump subunit AcrA (membrane-fusion protein)
MRFHLPRKLLAVLGRILLVASGLAVLVITIAWLSEMFETKVEPGWTERGVQRYTDEPTDVVHEVTKTYIEEAVGTLKASSRSIVSAKLLATIDEIHVKAGDHVKEGQELIRLDGKEFQTRLDQAKQTLEASIATHEQTQKEFARIKSLVQKKVVTPSEFDRATRDLQVAKANESRAVPFLSKPACPDRKTCMKGCLVGFGFPPVIAATFVLQWMQ